MVSRFVEYTKGIPLLKAYAENHFFRKHLEICIENSKESSKAEAKSIRG
jgi:ATP-binding cassette subfamily B protein